MAIFLIGWGVNSEPALEVGFVVLMLSLGIRFANQAVRRGGRDS